MKRSAKPPQLYKLTVDGRSPHTGYEWDLPERGQPGAWHEVKAPVVPHKNGFHLTSDPNRHWQNGREVWRVEVEDARLLEHSEDEWVARRVRLLERVPPAELDRLGVGVRRSWRRSSRAGTVRKHAPVGRSPVVRLVELVHGHALTSGRRRGDNLFDSCLWDAWSLALKSQMEFGPGDFAALAKLGLGRLACEHVYAAIVQTGNTSACKGWEAWQGRRPWMWQGARLHVGAELLWAGRSCKVTSIDDAKGAMIACSYKPKLRDDRGHERGRDTPDRRFTITREQLAAGDRAKKLGDAWQEASVELARLVFQVQPVRWGPEDRALRHLETLVGVWTPEQREQAAAWARARDNDGGKTRIKVPPRPAFVDEAREVAFAHAAEEERASAEWRASGYRDDPREVTGTLVCDARAALRRWAEGLFVGHPHEHLRASQEARRRASSPTVDQKPQATPKPRPEAVQAQA